MGIVIYDSFTDVDGTLLQNHTPEIGGRWQSLLGGIKIQSNAAVWNNGVGYYQNLTPMLGPEYDISFSIDAVTDNTTAQFHVYGRFEPFTNNFYDFYYDGTIKTWILTRRLNGIDSVLATVVQAIGTDLRRVRIEIRDSKKAVFLDGIEILSSANNDVKDAYRVGMLIPTNTTIALDDFTVVSASELLYSVELSQSLAVTPTRVAAYY